MDIGDLAGRYSLRFILNYTRYPVDGHTHRELTRYFTEFGMDLIEKPSPEVDRCGGVVNDVPCDLCGVRPVPSWWKICPHCGKDLRHGKPAPETDRCGGVNGRIFTPQIKGV